MGNTFCGGEPSLPRRRYRGRLLPSAQPVDLLPVPPDARRRALVIGINYYAQPSIQLDGCVNDAHRIMDFLQQRKYQRKDIRLLTDAPDAPPTERATRANIITGMKWLVHGARPGDSLFFFFAGHGSQVQDVGGDEGDGLDETILPMDHFAEGQIVDDVMWEIMVRPLPVGCRLTGIMDCCHSGTGLDLPYGLCADRVSWKKVMHRDEGDLEDSLQPLSEQEVAQRGSKGDVLLLSGCMDEETSADTTDVREITCVFPELNQNCTVQHDDDLLPLPPEQCPRGCDDNDFCMSLDDGEGWMASWWKKDPKKPTTVRAPPLPPPRSLHTASHAVGARAGGALTTAFTVLITSLEARGKVVKYHELLYGIREVLEQLNFTQMPQLSGSKPFRVDTPFQI